MRFSTVPGTIPSEVNPQELREFGKAALQAMCCNISKCEHDDPLECTSQVWEPEDFAAWVKSEKARLGLSTFYYEGFLF